MFNVDTYCALIILIELGGRYLHGGCTLKDISEKHHVPVDKLSGVTERLDVAGLIQTEDEWIVLKSAPHNIYIYDVVEMFCCDFSGSFVDKSTGAFLPQSNAMRLLEKESQSVKKAVKSSFRKVDLSKYCEMMKTYHF